VNPHGPARAQSNERPGKLPAFSLVCSPSADNGDERTPSWGEKIMSSPYDVARNEFTNLLDHLTRVDTAHRYEGHDNPGVPWRKRRQESKSGEEKKERPKSNSLIDVVA